MTTTIYFGVDEIKLTKIRHGKRGFEILSSATISLTEGCIINGVIIDEQRVLEALLKLKRDKNVKKCHVVFDSGLTMIKNLTAPINKPNFVLNFVKNSFLTAAEGYTEIIYDYSVLSKISKKSGKILAVAVEKEIIKPYISLFKSAKIKLLGIDIGLNSLIKLALYNTNIKDKAYIFAFFSGNTLITILFVNNEYYFSTRTNIFEEPSSAVFVSEIRSHLSAMIQFCHAQKINEAIKNIYFGGFDEETIEKFKNRSKSVNISYVDINTKINFKSKGLLPNNFLLNISNKGRG